MYIINLVNMPILIFAVYNVALNKPAYQHTDVYWDRFFWTADKAVDNCLLRDLPDYQRCCSSSQPLKDTEYPENYWRLNLTRPYEVVKIEIYAREGRPLSA